LKIGAELLLLLESEAMLTIGLIFGCDLEKRGLGERFSGDEEL